MGSEMCIRDRSRASARRRLENADKTNRSPRADFLTEAGGMWARAQALALGLGLLLLPLSLGESADVGGSGVRDGREDGVEAAGAPAGLARFPRFFNSRTMRVTQKDDPITHGYAAFIPAARPAYDARLDSSLPLARRINAGCVCLYCLRRVLLHRSQRCKHLTPHAMRDRTGYRLPNVFRPGEWAPLRRVLTVSFLPDALGVFSR